VGVVLDVKSRTPPGPREKTWSDRKNRPRNRKARWVATERGAFEKAHLNRLYIPIMSGEIPTPSTRSEEAPQREPPVAEGSALSQIAVAQPSDSTDRTGTFEQPSSSAMSIAGMGARVPGAAPHDPEWRPSRQAPYDPTFRPRTVRTTYPLNMDPPCQAIPGDGTRPSKFIALRDAGTGYLGKQAAQIMLTWCWPQPIPSHITGKDRERIATEFAQFYASVGGGAGYAVPKVIEVDLPKKAIAPLRDVYVNWGPLLSEGDATKYEEYTANLPDDSSYMTRGAQEMEIYQKWEGATIHGKPAPHVQQRNEPPRYDWDQEAETARERARIQAEVDRRIAQAEEDRAGRGWWVSRPRRVSSSPGTPGDGNGGP